MSEWIMNYDHIIVKALTHKELIEQYGEDFARHLYLANPPAVWCVYNTGLKKVISETVNSSRAAMSVRAMMIDQWENDCDTSEF